MIIRHSNQLLEHLTELEEKISAVEEILEDLGIEIDREKVLVALLSRRKEE